MNCRLPFTLTMSTWPQSLRHFDDQRCVGPVHRDQRLFSPSHTARAGQVLMLLSKTTLSACGLRQDLNDCPELCHHSSSPRPPTQERLLDHLACMSHHHEGQISAVTLIKLQSAMSQTWSTSSSYRFKGKTPWISSYGTLGPGTRNQRSRRLLEI